MNLMDKFKEFIENKNSKKFISNLFMILILGSAILIAANILIDDNTIEDLPPIVNENSNNDTSTENRYLIDSYADEVENKLKYILNKIEGVGNVEVMVTLEDTAERIPAFNTTTISENTSEKDAQGGVREVTKEDLTKQVVTSDGDSSLLVIKEIKPKVKGVIVVAQGAENIEIKEKLYLAVKTVLGISGNRVEIFSSN